MVSYWKITADHKATTGWLVSKGDKCSTNKDQLSSSLEESSSSSGSGIGKRKIAARPDNCPNSERVKYTFNRYSERVKYTFNRLKYRHTEHELWNEEKQHINTWQHIIQHFSSYKFGFQLFFQISVTFTKKYIVVIQPDTAIISHILKEI